MSAKEAKKRGKQAAQPAKLEQKRRKKVTLMLPDEIEGWYEGEHIRVTGISKWQKAKVFIDDVRVKGLLQRVVIDIAVDRVTFLHMDFKDIPLQVEKEITHYMIDNESFCGDDYPNIQKTDVYGHINCSKCLGLIETVTEKYKDQKKRAKRKS